MAPMPLMTYAQLSAPSLRDYGGSCGETLGTAPVTGWTPGSPPTSLPDNVGIRMSSGQTKTFQLQDRYARDLLIEPGDTIRTTCTFENTSTRRVQLGEKTSDEMCFNFLLVWPAGSMGVLAPGGYCIGPV